MNLAGIVSSIGGTIHGKHKGFTMILPSIELSGKCYTVSVIKLWECGNGMEWVTISWQLSFEKMHKSPNCGGISCKFDTVCLVDIQIIVLNQLCKGLEFGPFW
jgi:hypothetical protein